MKAFSFVILFLSSTFIGLKANENPEKEIRTQFYNASYEKISLEDFKEYLDKFESKKSPIYIGYESMYFMLLSRESWNPYAKYNNFLKGKEKLETAIKISPNNIELIFLRYCIQRTIPGILNYSDKIESDKKLLLSSWSSLDDSDLQERIKKYFVENDITKESFFNNNI